MEIRNRYNNKAILKTEPAKLVRADLRDADLRGADLRGADLRGADLTSADLTGTDLTGADLTGADLRGADLRGADFRDAKLHGANYGFCISNGIIPLQIVGLKYNIMIFSEGFIKADCYTKSINEWRNLIQFEEDNEFFQGHKDWLIRTAESWIEENF